MWVNGYQSSTPYLILMFCRFSFVRGQPLDLISALESFFLDIIEIGVFGWEKCRYYQFCLLQEARLAQMETTQDRTTIKNNTKFY